MSRNPAGLLCRLEIRSTGGTMMRVDSDDTWRASQTVIDGWQGATSWATAAPDIQSAVEAAVTTRTLVLVNDGI